MMRLFFFFFVIMFSFSFATCNVNAKEMLNQDYQNEVLKNWIIIVENAYTLPDSSENGTPGYNIASEHFFDLYKKSGDAIYLNFALHEADRGKREQIINELGIYERKVVSHIIQKLNNDILPDNYFDLTPFTVANIYHFYNITIDQGQEAKAKLLLDYWTSLLPNIYETDDHLIIFKIHSLVSGYNQLGDYQTAYRLGEYLIEKQPFPASHFAVDFFLTLDFSAKSSGYYVSSLKILQEQLLPLSEFLDDKYIQAIIRMNYAMTLFRIGNITEALKENEQVFSNLEYLPNPNDKAAIFNNLAIIYLNTGRFNQYLDFQLNALRIADKENNYSQQILILRNLYIFYRRQSETEQAFNYLEKALHLASEKNITEELAPLLISLGIYKRTVEDQPADALDYFYEARNHAINYSNYRQIFNSHFEIAMTYLLLEDFETAEKYINDIINLSQSRNDNLGYVQSHITLANSYIKSGRLEEANTILSRFTDSDFHQLTFEFRVLVHNISLQIKMENGRYKDALNESSEMISEIIDWLRESSNQETGHMRMDQEFSEAFRLHLNLLFRLNRPKEALYTIGSLRNISRSGFYNNPLLKSQMLTQEELIHDYQLSDRIRQLRGQYATAAAEHKVSVNNELITAISERNHLLNRAIPQYHDTPYENALRKLRRQLRSDQMVFHISVFDGQIFKFAITRGKMDMKVYPKDDYYQGLIKNATSSLGNGNTNLKDLHEVYTTFFEGDIPKTITHIYFIPDDHFYMLPLGILPVLAPESSDSYRTTSYFMERYSVSYANTLSDIVNKRGIKNDDFYYEMAGFGISNFSDAGHPSLTDLPFGPVEIIRSAEVLDHLTEKKIFLENESTKENFREISGKSRILHIATHSKVNNNNPLFSALYMHNGLSNNANGELTPDEHSGIMYAYELFDLNLNADLIFLSSCESGSGSYLQGTGILGFSRAFSYAGAQSLSLNLWPVRDRTAAEIAVRFYEALNEGKNKADALRSAQMSYMNHNNSDPYLWGAFVLYGNIDPVISTKGQHHYLYIMYFTLMFALIVLFRLYKKRNLVRNIIQRP
ncbi:MAG: CHAT domain-containing protein [Balneolaceae bacterium]|nr:MAG: CHAT domain-containing protein [Balneolaceae bacterium]